MVPPIVAAPGRVSLSHGVLTSVFPRRARRRISSDSGSLPGRMRFPCHLRCRTRPYSPGEQTLTEQVLRSLHAGDLMLADRGFFS